MYINIESAGSGSVVQHTEISNCTHVIVYPVFQHLYRQNYSQLQKKINYDVTQLMSQSVSHLCKV